MGLLFKYASVARLHYPQNLPGLDAFRYLHRA